MRISSSGRHGACALFVALWLATATSAARADGASAADMQTARQLLREGEDLKTQRDYPGALDKFRAAHALVPSPVTTRLLAFAYLDLGQLVEARETALVGLQMPKEASETGASAAARTEMQKLVADLALRIPSVNLKLSGARAELATVKLDGVEVPGAALDQPRRVNPGKHVVVVAVGAEPPTTVELELTERENRELTVPVPDAPEAAAPVPVPITPAPSPAPVAAPPPLSPPPVVLGPSASTTTEPGAPATSASGASTVTYLGLGTLAVGTVAGLVFGGLALSGASDLKSTCDGAACPRSQQSKLDAVKSEGTIANVSFAIAGVGGVLAVVGLLTSANASSANAANASSALLKTHWVSVGLGASGLEGSF
jgi:hypothetical protein